MYKLLYFLLPVFFIATAALAADETATSNGDAATATAAADSACSETTPCAEDCCHPRCVIEGCLKHQPLCEYPEHRCLTPCEPCTPCIDTPCACHKPLTPCIPGDCGVCPPRSCHKPLTVFMPEDVCARPSCKCHAHHEDTATAESCDCD